MAKSSNNEGATFALLKETILPQQRLVHIGGNRPNAPDIIIYDSRGELPLKNDTVPKAHYIISDQKLFIHSATYDPYLLSAAFNLIPITDKLVRLSKRSSGAVRAAGTAGGAFLGPDDYRAVSMGLRFWMSYPSTGYIDLRDEESRDIMCTHMHTLSQKIGPLPLVTIDAKSADSAQCTGPNILFDGEFTILGNGLTPDTEAEIVNFLRQDTAIVDKLRYYTDSLGVSSTKFRVVADNVPSGANCTAVHESVYNKIQFNEPLHGASFNLSAETFKRQVPVGEFFL